VIREDEELPGKGKARSRTQKTGWEEKIKKGVLRLSPKRDFSGKSSFESLSHTCNREKGEEGGENRYPHDFIVMKRRFLGGGKPRT